MKKLAVLFALFGGLFLAMPNEAPSQDKAPVKQAVKHGRGHKEPVTPEQKMARLEKHLDSHRRHPPRLQPLRAKALQAGFDCRVVNWVPAIVDQAQCGSCWDFSGVTVCTSAFMK